VILEILQIFHSKSKFFLFLSHFQNNQFFDSILNNNENENKINRKIRGRLKVCSKSLVFDPQDNSDSIIKFPFRDITLISEAKNSLHISQEVFVILSEKIVLMKENNVIAPYISKIVRFLFFQKKQNKIY